MKNNNNPKAETARILEIRRHVEQQERVLTVNVVTRSNVSIHQILAGGFKLGGTRS